VRTLYAVTPAYGRVPDLVAAFVRTLREAARGLAYAGVVDRDEALHPRATHLRGTPAADGAVDVPRPEFDEVGRVAPSPPATVG
jgi:hypothetical protein